jgi:protein SCO1/2
MKNSILLFAAIVVLAGVGCQKPVAAKPSATEQKVYEVRGIVRGINPARQVLIVEHEDVPGFMPSMTMPFDYRSPEDIAPLKAGDGILFQLTVTDHDSWVGGVKKIDVASVNLPKPAKSAATEARVDRLKEGDALPDFELTDDQSHRITRATFAGRPLFITFIFTRCPIPNFCPLMSRNFADVRKELASNPVLSKEGTQFLSISFDPEFDTPAQLTTYASNFAHDREGWRFASGTPAEITRLTKAFSVYVQPESGTISHGLCTALIGADGTIRKIWRGNSWEPSEAVAAVRGLANEAALAHNTR